VVTHLFGSGFPKSLDISKAIDKAAGAERTEVIGRTNRNVGNITSDRDYQGTSTFKESAEAREASKYLTKPATAEASLWQGFGTALKPASEHWILVRKPISEKTVAKNVLKHGTGGINIDASRIGYASKEPNLRNNKGDWDASANTDKSLWGNGTGERTEPHNQGRFPANLVLSHNDDCVEVCTPGCAVAELDRQSGALAKQGGRKKTDCPSVMFAGGSKDSTFYGDSGGASRFFYCAKASKSDKGESNTHPTVKSSKLMSYLIKMITPPKGIVLDPFMGSGSTGVAAVKEGFQFIGIEKDKCYKQIAEKRIFHAFPEFKKDMKK
jgi:hypothetical protein